MPHNFIFECRSIAIDGSLCPSNLCSSRWHYECSRQQHGVDNFAFDGWRVHGRRGRKCPGRIYGKCNDRYVWRFRHLKCAGGSTRGSNNRRWSVDE
jgi:hypothetical protein